MKKELNGKVVIHILLQRKASGDDNKSKEAHSLLIKKVGTVFKHILTIASTQLNEAFHSAKCKLATKRFCMTQSWATRVRMAVLEFNWPGIWKLSLASKLEKFNLDTIDGITKTDELELDKLGEEKMALFAIIPDNNTDFNFLVSMLYTQIFQVLYYKADYEHGGALPIPVHFVMDEFANVALPNDFEKILSTMRSRNISVSIIIQNLSQLKALFEKSWESIVGNCDELLYLGGNEQSSYKYISELLGKETIDTNTYRKKYRT